MAKPKILVVYKEKECADTLAKLKCLTKHFCEGSESLPPLEEIKEGAEYDLEVRTKYYTAPVQMVFYHYHPDDLEDMLGAVDNLNVVLYLFQETEELDEYLKFVLQMCKKAEPEISLLLFDSREEKLPDKYENLINKMCMEVFLEMVRTNIAHSYSNPVMQPQGMLSESKVGMDRVIESLQCNMWPNMERKPMDDLRAQMMQRFEEQVDQEEQKEEQEEEKEVHNEGDRNNEDKAEKEEPEQRQPPVYLDPLNPVLPIPDYAKTAHGTNSNDFEKEERNLEELGSLMVQMKNLKDQVQTMSLEDRRANAEDMIRKIAGFMDLGSDEDIFDSDEDEEYNKIIASKVDEEDAKNKEETSKAETS